MVDELDPNDATPVDPPGGGEFNDRFSEFLAKLNSNVEGFNAANEKFSGSAGKNAGIMELLGKGVDRVKGGVQSLGKTAENIKLGANMMEGMTGLQSVISETGTIYAKAMTDMLKQTGEFNKILGMVGPILATQVKKQGLEAFNSMTGGALDAQKQIMAVQKTALQASMAFGSTFTGAAGSADKFRENYADIMQTMHASEEELKGIGTAFKDTLSTEDQVTSISRLSDAQSALGTTLNATSAAMAIGAATGQDSGSIAKDIGQMYTELGEDLEGAISAFGDIGLAAEKSGIGFGKVKESIMSGTAALKMWGGTVGAVAPMYKTFADSLQDGQKGLAPELLAAFTKGLNSMGFETRALMGLQAGMGGGGGAIGAGLEMEAAMEQGPEGMQKVSESLTATLKQFGGGEIVTREQAIENPALQRNFMVQRGLLQQMLKTDEATATKMMGALQDMDANGMASSKGQKEKLSELMNQGKTVQEQSTDELAKADADHKAAVLKQGGEMIKELNTIFKSSDIGKLANRLNDAMRKMMVKGGATGSEALETFTKALQGKPTRQERNQAIKQIQKTEGVDRTTAAKMYQKQRRATASAGGAEGEDANERLEDAVRGGKRKRARRAVDARAGDEERASVPQMAQDMEKKIFQNALQHSVKGGKTFGEAQEYAQQQVKRRETDYATKGGRKRLDRKWGDAETTSTTRPRTMAERNKAFQDAFVGKEGADLGAGLNLPTPDFEGAAKQEEQKQTRRKRRQERKRKRIGSTAHITQQLAETQAELPVEGIALPPPPPVANAPGVELASTQMEMPAEAMPEPEAKKPMSPMDQIRAVNEARRAKIRKDASPETLKKLDAIEGKKPEEPEVAKGTPELPPEEAATKPQGVFARIEQNKESIRRANAARRAKIRKDASPETLKKLDAIEGKKPEEATPDIDEPKAKKPELPGEEPKPLSTMDRIEKNKESIRKANAARRAKIRKDASPETLKKLDAIKGKKPELAPDDDLAEGTQEVREEIKKDNAAEKEKLSKGAGAVTPAAKTMDMLEEAGDESAAKPAPEPKPEGVFSRIKKVKASIRQANEARRAKIRKDASPETLKKLDAMEGKGGAKDAIQADAPAARVQVAPEPELKAPVAEGVQAASKVQGERATAAAGGAAEQQSGKVKGEMEVEFTAKTKMVEGNIIIELEPIVSEIMRAKFLRGE